MKFWRIALVGLVALVAGMAWLWPGPMGVTHLAIRMTAVLAVATWAWGTVELLLLTSSAREIWSFACLVLVNHILAAFHFGHQWSQSAALEHTRQMAGLAEGLYVNYFVVLVWMIDVFSRWNWHQPRSRWREWSLHGFLAFIFFNATVIYGSWFFRGLGLVIVAGFLGIYFTRKARGSRVGIRA